MSTPLALSATYPLKILVDTLSDLIATSGQPVFGGSNEETTIWLQKQGVLDLFWDDGFLEVVDYLQKASKHYADDSIKSLLPDTSAPTPPSLWFGTVASLSDQCSVQARSGGIQGDHLLQTVSRSAYLFPGRNVVAILMWFQEHRAFQPIVSSMAGRCPS